MASTLGSQKQRGTRAGAGVRKPMEPCESCNKIRFDDNWLDKRWLDDELEPKMMLDNNFLNGGWCNGYFFETSEDRAFRRVTFGAYNDIFPKLPTLRAASKAGCPLCASVLHRLDGLDIQLPDLEKTMTLNFQYGFCWALDPNTGAFKELLGLVVEFTEAIEFEPLITTSSWPFTTFTYYIYSSGDDAPSRSVARRLGLQPRDDTQGTENVSEERIGFLRRSLEICEREHKHDLGSATPFTPTRLIDLGPTTHSHGYPHLIVPGELGDRLVKPVRYAALSYCWGKGQGVTEQNALTAANIREKKCSMPMESLPEVAQDAVRACRHLSIRYLWIDAFCIIQPTEDAVSSDWKRESELMGYVYERAFVTLCAISSPSCRQGFLRRHSPPRPMQLPFQSSEHPEISGTFTLVDRGATPLGGKWRRWDPFTQEINTSRWNERGWTFQERYLSTRLVLFGESMMHVACSNGLVSESGYRRAVGEKNLTELLYDPTHLSSEYELCLQKARLVGEFYHMCYDYPRRKLTNHGDRLPALAGFAKRVSERTGDQYFAGLWGSTLYYALLWTLKYPQHYMVTSYLQWGENILRDLEPPIPTWSWLAHSGDWILGLGKFSPLADLHIGSECDFNEVGTVLRDPADPFGPTISGKITLFASVTPFTALPGGGEIWGATGRTETSGVFHLEGTAMWVAFHWNNCEDYFKLYDKPLMRMVLIASSCGGIGMGGGRVESEDELREYAGRCNDSSTWFERDGSMRTCQRCNDQGHNRNAWGLVVYPTGPAKQGVPLSDREQAYFRVGLFTLRAEPGGGTEFFRGADRMTLNLV